MPKSEVLKLAELEARTQLLSQALGLLIDPLWSTVGGFVAVHELQRAKLIGPVAEDVLYAGIIAVNTGRSPGLVALAGQGLGLALGGAAVAGAGAVVAGKPLLARVAGVAKATVKTLKGARLPLPLMLIAPGGPGEKVDLTIG